MRPMLIVVMFSLIAVGAAGQVPAISIEDRVRNEGTSRLFPIQYIDVTVRLSQATTQDVSVDWDLESGTAMLGEVGPESGTVTIPAGSLTGTINIFVAPDFIYEPDEFFFLNLSNPVNATIADGRAQVTLLNDDPPPAIGPTEGEIFIAEGDTGTTQVPIRMRLSPASLSPVTFTYATESGSVSAPDDYVEKSGTITLAPGQTEATFVIDIVGDVIDEQGQLFYVRLALAEGSVATLPAPRISIYILDDDFPPADVSITKTGPASYIPGSTITYNLVVSNAGPEPAPSVRAVDTLPAGTTLVSAVPSQGSCNGTATVVCELGSLASGASATIALTVLAPSTPQTLSNTATVITRDIDDPNPANNTSPAVITAPAAVAPIPTLSTWALLALLAGITIIATFKVR